MAVIASLPPPRYVGVSYRKCVRDRDPPTNRFAFDSAASVITAPTCFIPAPDSHPTILKVVGGGYPE